MHIFIISYFIFINILKNYDDKYIYNLFFSILGYIIIIKFVSDFSFLGLLISPYFIIEKIAIYNYYDYFPFIYLLAVLISVRNIYHKNRVFFSLTVLSLSLIIIPLTSSRLFIGMTLLAPIVFLFHNSININKRILFILYLLTVIVLTLCFSYDPYFFNEVSLQIRLHHWYSFFNSYEAINIIFPFQNEYRISMDGSFHNEFLELFSYYGLFAFFYIYFFYLMLKNTAYKYNQLVKLLFFILIIGMLIQLNLLNPYISMIVALFLSAVHDYSPNKKQLPNATKPKKNI